MTEDPRYSSQSGQRLPNQPAPGYPPAGYQQPYDWRYANGQQPYDPYRNQAQAGNTAVLPPVAEARRKRSRPVAMTIGALTIAAMSAGLGGVGATTQTFKSVLGGKVYIHYTSAMPSVYDPSFMKTFAQSANLFTDIYTYREEPHLTWYENDWTAQVVVVASTLCRSITVTNATA
jgi:hypothetical protein